MGCMAEPKICVIHSVSGGTPFSCLQRARPFDENRWPGFAPAGDLLSCLCKKARQRSTARFRAPSGFPPCGAVGRGASQTRPAGSNSEAPFSARHRLRLARQRARRLCPAERLRWLRRVVSFAAHQATCARRHNGGRQPAHPATLHSARQRGMGCQPATIALEFVGRISHRRTRRSYPTTRLSTDTLRIFALQSAHRAGNGEAEPACHSPSVPPNEARGRRELSCRCLSPEGEFATRPAGAGRREGTGEAGGTVGALSLLPFLRAQERESPAGAKPGQRTSDTRTPRRQGGTP